MSEAIGPSRRGVSNLDRRAYSGRRFVPPSVLDQLSNGTVGPSGLEECADYEGRRWHTWCFGDPSGSNGATFTGTSFKLNEDSSEQPYEQSGSGYTIRTVTMPDGSWRISEQQFDGFDDGDGWEVIDDTSVLPSPVGELWPDVDDMDTDETGRVRQRIKKNGLVGLAYEAVESGDGRLQDLEEATTLRWRRSGSEGSYSVKCDLHRCLSHYGASKDCCPSALWLPDIAVDYDPQAKKYSLPESSADHKKLLVDLGFLDRSVPG